MIDFKRLTSESDLYNFHSHTQFCDGEATMDAFARAAVDAGFAHYGFSPHSPIPIESPCNMSEADVELYLAEYDRLKKLYANAPTRFYASMEIDFLNSDHGPASNYYQSLPLDYRIGSVHFIPTRSGRFVDIDGRFESFRRKMDEFFDNDLRYVVDTFVDQSLQMIQLGGFDLIGHYDKVSHNAAHFRPGIEEEDWFARRMEQLTDAVIASGVAVEINTKTRADHGRFFPDLRHWRRLKEAGVTLVVNSDVHHPTLLNASRPEALRLLHTL